MEDGVRPGCLREGALIFAVAILVSCSGAGGMCPSRCFCHDDTLQASCVAVGLEVVPIQLNPDVQMIDLHDNRIVNVHFTLTFYMSLTRLDVSQNRIQSLGGRNFESQGRLLSLNVSHNHVSILGKDTFRGLKALNDLDLSNNQIDAVEDGAFRDTIQLQILDMSNNRITFFEDVAIFKSLKSLRVLNLEGNQILDIPSAVLQQLPTPSPLETLALFDNLIEVLDERSFPAPVMHNLRVLTLGSNVISDLHQSTFNALHSLASLDLSYNNLTSIPTQPLSKLSQLTELDLSGNNFVAIRPVAFQSLFQLKTLRLNRMPFLSRVDSRTFVDNIRLESVLLEENVALETLPTRAFHGNPHLSRISVRSNALTTLDASHFPLDRLSSLDVSGNPLHCNCSLLWLWTLTQLELKASDTTPAPNVSDSELSLGETHSLRINLHNLKCASPEALRGRAVVEVPEGTVRCETTWLTVAMVTALILALCGTTCVVLLTIGSERKMCSCRRGKNSSDSVGADTRRLAASNPGPPPILMLMPEKDFHGYQQNGELKYLEPWRGVRPSPIARNEYSLDLTPRKPPHIVYV